MNRVAVMLVAVLCYFAFFVSFVYFVGFIAGCPALPTHVDKGLSAPAGVAIVVDLALIALFGVQHSVMARSGFKAGLTRIVPVALERSVYCLASAAALAALFAFWHPLPGVVWDIADPNGRTIVWALFALGVGTVFISTWLIDHFELFGLAQAWSYLRGTSPSPAQFRTPLFYRYVRHPIYFGFLVALWAAPTMTAGHVLLSLGLTIYMLIGIRYEEADLVRQFGATYVEYKAKVAMILPRAGR